MFRLRSLRGWLTDCLPSWLASWSSLSHRLSQPGCHCFGWYVPHPPPRRDFFTNWKLCVIFLFWIWIWYYVLCISIYLFISELVGGNILRNNIYFNRLTLKISKYPNWITTNPILLFRRKKTQSSNWDLPWKKKKQTNQINIDDR